MQTTIIQPGDELKLPKNCNINTDNNLDNNINENDIKHVVTKNETLYSIAQKYGTTVDDIIEYNNLSTNVLQLGQILYIPNTSEYINYYVQSNDSLYSISRRFNTTIDAIKKLNNLTSDTLYINQLLLIP